MKGRIRIAAVGLVVITVLTALTSTAGASTTTSTWNVTGNGGFVGLDLLSALQIAGGGSEADASSAPLSEASGTGLCIDTSVTTNPCPTSATASLSGEALQTTQDAVAKGAGTTATPTGASGCTIPLNTGIINVDVSCGTASASEDSTGNPTASGTGTLANVSVSLSLTSVLSGLLGGSLPSAGSLCSGTSAATTAGGAGLGSLTGTLGSLLTTVNGLLGGLSLPGLNGSTVDTSSTGAGTCSLLGGLLNSISGEGGASVLTGILNQVLGLAGGNSVGISPLTIDVGGSTTAVSTSGNVVTDSVEQHAVDINLFGLADLQVAPTTAAVSLNRGTGVVTPSCNAGVLSYSTMGGLQNILSLGPLTSTLNNLLGQLSSTLDGLTSALSTLIGDLIAYQTPGNLLNCNTSAPGSTASASVGVLNVGLLTGLMGGVGLNVGDVSVSGSATNATPAVTTAAATTPAAPAAAPAPAAAAPASSVPNVTTVHTGEFWSGSLPIILLTGMGLAGIMLIGRRRIFSVARSINPIARRRGGQ
ncbi:MAG TPA: hypothetical protein VIY26_16085 [Acidimicrobiales bacterium]